MEIVIIRGDHRAVIEIAPDTITIDLVAGSSDPDETPKRRVISTTPSRILAEIDALYDEGEGDEDAEILIGDHPARMEVSWANCKPDQMLIIGVGAPGSCFEDQAVVYVSLDVVRAALGA